MSTDAHLTWRARRRPRHPLADVVRDLLDELPEADEPDRARREPKAGRTAAGAAGSVGTWAKALYSPKWTSTTYTLLLLRHLGLPHDNPQARRGCELTAGGRLLSRTGGFTFSSRSNIARRASPAWFWRSWVTSAARTTACIASSSTCWASRWPTAAGTAIGPKGATHGILLYHDLGSGRIA